MESNDTLYGSDVKFLREVNTMVSNTVNDLLKILANIVSY